MATASDNNENAKPLAKRIRLRSETEVGSIGIAAAAILLAAMSSMAWWTTRTHVQEARTARVERLRAVGTTLSQAAESMLLVDDLAGLRRMVSDVSANDELTDCRISLPDGQVIAAADASQITLRKLPNNWSGRSTDASGIDDEQVSNSSSTFNVSFPLDVLGRGAAKLEMEAKKPAGLGKVWQTQTGLGVVGAASMLLILAMYRRARTRLRAVIAVYDALNAIAAGEKEISVLKISAELGHEANAWNDLLADRDAKRVAEVEAAARTIAGGDSAASSIDSAEHRASNDRRGARGDLDAAFDAMSQGVVLIDGQLRIKHINGAAARFLRTERDQANNATIASLIQQADVLDSITGIISGAARHKKTIEVERSGEEGAGVLRFSIRPVRRDDSAAAMLVIDDITQQKVAEQSRNSFVAHATHELRTPLTNIRLYIETAIEDGEHDAAIRGKCLNVINQETRRLERIVGEMLSVSEIEAGSLRLRKDDVRLDVVMEELKFDFEAQAQEHKITLTYNIPPKLPVIHGDRDKLVLAMHNLVGNAIKYTPENGTVTVSIDVGPKQLSFAVADTGIGISDEDAERIFERFYRAKDSRVDKITGTGLGLTLAREVIRLHGGDVTVQSELNKGSTFTLAMPVEAVPDAA